MSPFNVLVFSVSHLDMMNVFRYVGRTTCSIPTTQLSLSNYHRLLSRSVLVATLSIGGVLSGLAPNFSQQASSLFFNSPAYAQSRVSDAEIRQFALAAYKIERHRQQLYTEAKRALNPVPANFCSQPNLPANLPSLCNTFLVTADQAIRDSGLSAARFYEIYNRQEKDPALRARIDEAISTCQSERRCR
jgi:hypothetical protein